MIARFLSTRDLSALSLTSTYHRSCTEPTLYKEICWNPKDLDISWPQYHWAPLHLLLRTLMSRPELASYIRCFAINCRRPRNGASHSIIWRCGESEYEYSTDDMKRATALIKSLHLPKAEKWIADLKWGEVDLFLGLLISTFTNLRCFHLSIDYQQVCKIYFGEILGRSVTQNSLCKLQTIEFGGNVHPCESFSAIDMRQVDQLFSIPSLKRISISLPNNLFSPSFSLAGLSSLELHHRTICPSGLGRILLATPCLQSLKYDSWIEIHEAPPDPRKRWQYLDCAELGRELAHVKSTLEQLHICISWFRTPEPVGARQRRFPRGSVYGTVGKVGTLREFIKLTSLTMPTCLIVDCDSVCESYSSVRLLPLQIANVLPVNTLKQLLLQRTLRPTTV